MIYFFMFGLLEVNYNFEDCCVFIDFVRYLSTHLWALDAFILSIV